MGGYGLEVCASMTGGRTCLDDRCYRKPVSWGDTPESVEATPSTQDLVDLEQQMIDYSWEFFSRMVVWTLQTACTLALFRIPDGYDQFEDVLKVERFINGISPRGTTDLIPKVPFKSGELVKMATSKLSKKLGRAHEIKQKILHHAKEGDIHSLFSKTFGRSLSLWELENEIDHLKSQIQEKENSQRREALKHGRFSLQNTPAVKSRWIQPMVSSKGLRIQVGDDVTLTKMHSLRVLKQHWSALMDSVQWTQELRQVNELEMTSFFVDKINPARVVHRPGVDEFRAALRSVGGCPGIDGWTTAEIGAVSDNSYLSNRAWMEMRKWEDAGITPSSIKDALHCYVVKPGKANSLGVCLPKHMRPLTVFSCFWRAWSKTWIKNEAMSDFISSTLPLPLAAAFRGGPGSEALAALLAHELSRLGFGATLDFSHCFDTVDLRSLHVSLRAALPIGLQPWLRLLFHQWSNTRRWFSLGGIVDVEPWCMPVGIPQGDSASPLMLALCLWQGYCEVDATLAGMEIAYVQGIYMDDRTLIAESPDAIELGINIWRGFAARRRLLENSEKIQKVSVSDIVPDGYKNSMEVLGVCIGCESPLGLTVPEKQLQRVHHALTLCARVGILPEARWKRLSDLHSLVSGFFGYGWVSTAPSRPSRKVQTMLIRKFQWSIGYMRYGLASLRSILLFTHLDVCEKALVHQVRLLAVRDKTLARWRLPVVACALDHMVYAGLCKFGWQKAGLWWMFGSYSFSLEQCADHLQWSRISHVIRDSIRKWHYQQLAQLNRHELIGVSLPPFSQCRIDLVRAWIKRDSLAMLLATGSVMSAAARQCANDGVIVKCPKCKVGNVHWEHYWLCWLETSAPEDPLLRRFLWPRSKADLVLCDNFKWWTGKLIAEHAAAKLGETI